MADATITIGGDINELKRRLKEAGGEIKGFGDRAKKDVSGIDFGKALGIAGGIAGLQRLLTVGFRFNQTMGDSQVAIANIIQRFQGLNEEAAKNEAKKAMEAIVALEPKTAATLEGLTQGFLATFASAQQAGISVEENIDLVGKFANALANANIPADQLVQELRSIFTGNITSDSALAKMLEIRPQDVAAAKEAGKLYEFLNKKVGELGLSGDTAGVAFSSLASAIDKSLGLATEGLFKQSVDGAKDLSEWLDKNADGFRALGEMAAGAMSFIGTTFSYAGGLLDDFLAGLDEASRMLFNLPSQTQSQANKIAEGVVGGAMASGASGAAGGADGVPRILILGEAMRDEAAAEAAKKEAQYKGDVLRITRELQRVDQMREQIGEREFRRLLDQLSPMMQVQEIQKRITAEKERQSKIMDPQGEEEILEDQKRLMDLEDQLAEAVRRRGEAQAEAAREAADAAADAARQTQAMLDVEREMALLTAQALGDKKKVAAIEREMAIEQTKRAIMSQTGADETKARAIAEKMQRLREMAASREEEDGRSKSTGSDEEDGQGKIRGYSFRERGSARDKLKGLLNDYYAMQQRGGMDRQNPSEAIAAKNAKEATSGKDLGSRMDKLIEVTSKGLLGE